jgi:hypothetical protein
VPTESHQSFVLRTFLYQCHTAHVSMPKVLYTAIATS